MYTKSIILFLFILLLPLTYLNARSLTLLLPKHRQYISQEEYLEISWYHKDISGDISIEYKTYNQWVLIGTEQAEVGSYFWSVPRNIYSYNGKIGFRIKSNKYSWIIDEVTLRVVDGKINQNSYYADKYFFFEKHDNIRSGPSTNYPVIANPKSGESFFVIARHNTWYQVQFFDKTAGVTVGFAHQSNGRIINMLTTGPLPIEYDDPPQEGDHWVGVIVGLIILALIAAGG